MQRIPAVAGQFYFGEKEKLIRQIKNCFVHELGPGRLPEEDKATDKRKIIGAIVPHAGYMFSGAAAAHVYKQLAESKKPDTVVIIGPNHTGVGSGLSVYPEGTWKTPIGSLEIDSEFAKEILKCGEMIDLDENAHKYEHSIEVQLPFIQFIWGNSIKIVPICMMLHDLDASDDVAYSIADASENLKRDIVILASSDFSHYVPERVAYELDRLAIETILKLDEEKLIKTIERKKISMCGFAPISSMIVAAKEFGAKKAELLKYYTSGDILGDKTQVVGYAAITVE